ncbi:hypothetical protein F5H01DRAFT_344988 [Linnemannia elongata]|nr:hypothetical protein F5H01DRAFT_344988 [Linnemannia elongata]
MWGLNIIVSWYPVCSFVFVLLASCWQESSVDADPMKTMPERVERVAFNLQKSGCISKTRGKKKGGLWSKERK